jgi:hypothetical protein
VEAGQSPTVRRSVRSWVTRTIAAEAVRRASPSSSTSATERWLVGSSSRKHRRPVQQNAGERRAEVGVAHQSGRADLIDIPCAEDLGRRELRVEVILLGQQADLRALRDGDRARVGRDLAGQHEQQRGLPRSALGPSRRSRPRLQSRIGASAGWVKPSWTATPAAPTTSTTPRARASRPTSLDISVYERSRSVGVCSIRLAQLQAPLVLGGARFTPRSRRTVCPHTVATGR